MKTDGSQGTLRKLQRQNSRAIEASWLSLLAKAAYTQDKKSLARWKKERLSSVSDENRNLALLMLGEFDKSQVDAETESRYERIMESIQLEKSRSKKELERRLDGASAEMRTVLGFMNSEDRLKAIDDLLDGFCRYCGDEVFTKKCKCQRDE